MKRLSKEEIAYRNETIRNIKLYFQGNPTEGIEALKLRVKVLKRKGIMFTVYGLDKDK